MTLLGYCALSIAAALLFSLSALYIHLGFHLAVFQTPHPNTYAFDNRNTHRTKKLQYLLAKMNQYSWMQKLWKDKWQEQINLAVDFISH